jgi:predicted RNA-binding protein with PUA-like domain
LLASRRGAIGTRLLNLNVADNDHPEPRFRTTGRAALAGNLTNEAVAGAMAERGGRAGPCATGRNRGVVARSYWLMKSEPSECSIDAALAAPGRTVPWTGVRNYQARNFMRDAMQVGDGVLFYHSSCAEPGVAGLAEVARAAYPDATQFDPRSPYFDAAARPAAPRWVHVDVRALEKTRVLPIAEMRRHAALSDMILLKRGNRLSITPVTPTQWQFVLRLLRAS